MWNSTLWVYILAFLLTSFLALGSFVFHLLGLHNGRNNSTDFMGLLWELSELEHVKLLEQHLHTERMRYLQGITDVAVVPDLSTVPDIYQMLPKSLLSRVIYNKMYIEDRKVSTDGVVLVKNYGDIGCPPWRESTND